MKKNKDWRGLAGRLGKKLWASLSNNLWLKLLSVVLALFLWSYVISTTPSITRDKTLSDISITVTGQSVLEDSRGLAVLTDLNALESVRVRVRVSQSSYAQVTSDNVRVELDLSSIRQEGKQSVRLQGSTTYGSVVEVYPQYIDLEVEKRDQRYVPVNVELTGVDTTSYWYSVSSRNPSQVVVSGPTSLVKTVSSAQVLLDVSGLTETHSWEEGFQLLDAQQQEIPGALSVSTSSVRVTVEVYPIRVLTLSQEADQLTSGQVPEGYRVDQVEVNPTQVVVAAEQALLDGLTELTIEPVDLTGATQTFTAIAQVQTLKGIKYLSSDEVSVTVTISEQELTKRFSNVSLNLENQPQGMRAMPSAKRVDVKVTGPYSLVSQLIREDIQATVDLAGLTQGQYELPVEIAVDNYPDLACSAQPAAITVTVSQETSGQNG